MNILLTVLSVVLFAACQSESLAKLDVVESRAGKHESEQAEDFIIHGKPSAPIKIHYTLKSVPEVGQPLEIDVLLNSTLSGKAVNAKMSHSEKLGYSKVFQKMTFKSGASSSDTQVITIVPQSEGIHYVNIYASIDVDGVIQSKAFLIPVEVGNVDWNKHLKINGVINDDGAGTGGKVISMPAQ